MNWQEIAGGIMQAFRNAGVKKDVIDLQEKHLALLTKEIETLTLENAKLRTKVTDLEKELDSLRPKSQILDEDQIKFLGLLFNQDLPIAAISQKLGINIGLANYHKDVLMEARIDNPRALMPHAPLGDLLASKGLKVDEVAPLSRPEFLKRVFRRLVGR